jgi:putative flippase GtrA
VKIQLLIIQIIDWLYKPFRNIIPLQTFRYAVTGGTNTSFDILLYFISYNYIIKKKMISLKIITISPHIAAFLMSFSITFFTGFLLAKYITFQESLLRGRIQLFRYFVTVLVCMVLNYAFLKIFVEVCHIYPTPSKIITTILVVIYSYFSQKYFSFQMHKATVPVGTDSLYDK